jgi:hypothetical protein
MYEYKFDKCKATVDNGYRRLEIMLLVRKPTTVGNNIYDVFHNKKSQQ